MADGGRKHRPPILYQPLPGRSQHQWTTKESWDAYGTRLSHPNPWVRILGRANESEIEIGGIKSKALTVVQ